MITIWDWFENKTPMQERYRLIKEVGFDGILMWWSNEFGRDNFGKDDYRNGPEIARKAGLFIENIHVPVENQNNLWLDNLEGKGLMECYLKCVKDCNEFEIPTMVVHPPSDDYLCDSLGLDRIKRIAEYAEQFNVNVAFENVHNHLNLSYILEQVNSVRIGFCYDSGHHHSYYPDFDFSTEYSKRLMALHLHDNNGIRAQHGLPFDGEIDWDLTMLRIAATGYTGAIALEPMQWDYENYLITEFLELAFSKARKLEELRG